MCDEAELSPSVFKILLVGPSGVGKTSLLLKYIKGKFSYDYQVTIGVEFYTKNLLLNEKTPVRLQIWDTAGQEAFRSVVRSFYKGVSAIILMYSIDSRESFEDLSGWMKEIKEHVHPKSVFVLAAAKLDLQEIRQVSTTEGQDYLKSIGGDIFLEFSAKSGENVRQLFEKLARTLHKKTQESKVFGSFVKPIENSSKETPKSQSFNLKHPIMVQRQYFLTQRDSSCC